MWLFEFFKELPIPVISKELTIFNFLKTMVIYQNRVFIVLEPWLSILRSTLLTMRGGSVPVSNDHATLVVSSSLQPFFPSMGGLTLCKIKIVANILKGKNLAAKGPSSCNAPTNRGLMSVITTCPSPPFHRAVLKIEQNFAPRPIKNKGKT